MSQTTLIPIVAGRLGGASAQLVDARLLHQFLESAQDYSTWIKRRIRKYGFEENVDYLIHQTVEQVPHQGSTRSSTKTEYFLTLDTAKEVAMVERTSRGRWARRYFIECERQLYKLKSRDLQLPKPIVLSRAKRQAINRQAWAEASEQIHAVFHARREALLRRALDAEEPILLPPGYRPSWAK
ncbi:antA/AntB antirepressor family protein [Hahella sp. HN01]|uniref:antA/AntB antirepressor family protein n=1 Tax=Hahella sp. HN01 TaxID=2847262 RepID=UPI001C1EB863|nr:antA/AntB antirepressor family protein [Hahella sp. HN01]MBU6955505.1 antA/AntB antirepressor family protein [Hahella sp. HN01]